MLSPTMKIALLINTNHQDKEDNCWRFSRQLLALGHQVYLCPIDSLALSNRTVIVDAFLATTHQEPDLKGLQSVSLSLVECAFVWVLGLGQRGSFLDKLQMLRIIEPSTPIMNPLDCILHLKSKYLLNSLPEVFPQPDSYASTDWQWLLAVMQETGGNWIIKPPAGSFGRDVFKVNARDDNAAVILQNMTGHDGSQYCLLQRHIESVNTGEKRVLFAAGQVVGHYLRSNSSDHRTNLAQGAVAGTCELTPQEQLLCQKVGRHLEQQGTGYIAMDMIYPYVIELNVINPGGLGTLETLTGHDFSAEVVSCILAKLASAATAGKSH